MYAVRGCDGMGGGPESPKPPQAGSFALTRDRCKTSQFDSFRALQTTSLWEGCHWTART